MAFEDKGVVQRNTEASLKCLNTNGYHESLRTSLKLMKATSIRRKDEITFQNSLGAKDAVQPGGMICVENSNVLYNKPAANLQHECWGFSAFYNELYKVQQYQMNALVNHYYLVSIDNQYQYGPHNIHPQGYPASFQLQEFQYFVVIDFEATCDKEKKPHPQEIIEFPSVIVSSVTGQLEACFQTYVRPTCNQFLSDFCKDLTGIQQIQVDRGVTLSEALLRHDKWLEKKGIKQTNFAVVTWSDWDCRVMLESECRFKKIRKPPYFNRWINLKVPFREAFGTMNCNLKEAIEMSGLVWQGRAHCGLDDAKNTARLLALLMQRGLKLSITNSIMWHASEVPPVIPKQMQCPETMPPARYQFQRAKDMAVPCLLYQRYCLCGAISSRGMVRKPGPMQGKVFFGCGNWSATRGACCHYFEWASA